MEGKRYSLVLSKDGREASNLLGKGGADVLGGVCHQVLDAGDDLLENHLLREERGEAWDLGGSGGLDLSLVVLEQKHEGGHKLVLRDVSTTGLRKLK